MSNIKDLFIMLILSYLIIYIIIIIYNSITKHIYLNRNNQDGHPEQFKEDFSNNYIGKSLTNLNGKVSLSFPGSYLETVYRPATITENIKNLVNFLIRPILLTINQKEGYYFRQGDIINFISREYKMGTSYYLNVFIIDAYTPISCILKLTGVITNLQQHYLNTVNILSNRGN